jgi:hypothetical protein
VSTSHGSSPRVRSVTRYAFGERVPGRGDGPHLGVAEHDNLPVGERLVLEPAVLRLNQQSQPLGMECVAYAVRECHVVDTSAKRISLALDGATRHTESCGELLQPARVR